MKRIVGLKATLGQFDVLTYQVVGREIKLLTIMRGATLD
jgi:hypothetical protein